MLQIDLRANICCLQYVDTGWCACVVCFAAIVEAGPLRVRQLDLKYCRINIVSTTKDQKYGHAQREIERGLYVLTHSNTKDKKKMLDRISNALHLGWTVEIIDK